jgi:hypothetical protein
MKIDFLYKPQSNPDADPLNHGEETLRKNKEKLRDSPGNSARGR